MPTAKFLFIGMIFTFSASFIFAQAERSVYLRQKTSAYAVPVSIGNYSVRSFLPVSAKNRKRNSPRLRISPNPSQAVFRLIFSEDVLPLDIFVYNSAGKIVKKQLISSSHAQINLNKQVAGIYFLHINNLKGYRSFAKLILKK